MKFEADILKQIGFKESQGTGVGDYKVYRSPVNKGYQSISVRYCPIDDDHRNGGWTICQSEQTGFTINPPQSYKQLYQLLDGLGIKFKKIDIRDIEKRRESAPAPIELNIMGGAICSSRTCPYLGKCANHEDAGIYRSEGGLTPTLFRIDDKVVLCHTQKHGSKTEQGSVSWDPQEKRFVLDNY